MRVDRENPLLIDLYELTMADAYLAEDMSGLAVFEFFVRKLPEQRGFLLAAGLEQTIDYLVSLRFDGEALAWVAQSGRFSSRLIDYLTGFRFTGDVDAMPEGSVFFPNEPILRVTAPMPQAQLVETRLMNLLNFETIIASKAVRMVLSAPGRQLIDFGATARARGGGRPPCGARELYCRICRDGDGSR